MSVTKESEEVEGGKIELRETSLGRYKVVLLGAGSAYRDRMFLEYDSEKDARAAFHLLSKLTQSLK